MKETTITKEASIKEETVMLGDTTSLSKIAPLHENQLSEIHSWMKSFGGNLELIPELRKTMISITESLVGMTNAQNLVAKSVESNSKNNEELKDSVKLVVSLMERAEVRHNTMQDRFMQVAEHKGGKDQMPLKVFYITMASFTLVIVGTLIMFSSLFGIDFKSKFIEITTNQKATQELITRKVEEIKLEEKK